MFQADKELTIPNLTGHPCLPKWRKRIAKARQRSGFTRQDINDAWAWDYCAVGEAYNAGLLSDNPDDWPYGLLKLGGKFGRLVDRHDFDAADSVLTQIERALTK